MTSNMDDMSSSEMNSSSDLQLMDTSPDSIIPESDNDSGIVALVNSHRIGSTASNSDEDHNFKDKVNQSTNLSLSYGAKPRVRFDDELPLSEQNMRKSCKKLFETLLQQNKECPTPAGPIPVNPDDQSVTKSSSLLPSCHCHRFQTSNNNCCTHTADHNHNGESFDDNELLITTYGQQYNYGPQTGGQTVTRRQKYHTLDNRQSRSQWSLSHNKVRTAEDVTDRKSAFNCNAALDRIKRMSDQLESASMVNAFARPAFIKSPEFAQNMDILYETIFPTEKPDNSVNSSNSHMNRWLNNKLGINEDRPTRLEEDSGAGNRDVNVMIDSPHKHLLSESNSRKSILKAI
ncbi:unnamed protein product, partial [Oppiella nova]